MSTIKVGDLVRCKYAPRVFGRVESITETGLSKRPLLVRYQTGTITVRGETHAYFNTGAPDELEVIEAAP